MDAGQSHIDLVQDVGKSLPGSNVVPGSAGSAESSLGR